MDKNGLELINIEHSAVKKYTENDDGSVKLFTSLNFKNMKAFFVAYLDYAVHIGTWENDIFHYGQWENNSFNLLNEESIPQQYIQKLRIFNKDQEFFVWRTREKLKGRLRMDFETQDSESIEVVVAQQALFGTKKGRKSNNGYTEITEDRGTTLNLPFENLDVNQKENRVFIKTYNYIKYHPITYQASYVDCRFVNFCDKNNDLI